MKNVGGNASVLRKINNDVVLDALKIVESASLAELARTTGLSLATCANIVGDLLAQGEVAELGERRSRGGRPARRFRFNPDNSQFVSVLLGATRGAETLKCFVTNYAGAVSTSTEVREKRITPETIDSVVGDAIGRFPLVKAVALSIPGLVRAGVVTACELPALAGVPVEERIRSRFGVQAVAENDMNFAAMGYFARIPAPGVSSLAYVLFPDNLCVGSGIVVNGMLLKGKSNFAGEISHLPFAGAGVKPLKSTSSRAARVQYVAKIVVALTAVVNPDVLVFSGEALGPDMLEDIRKDCLAVVPAEHLPVMTYKQDYDDDCLAGMLAMARNSVSFAVQMVERDRNWCPGE